MVRLDSQRIELVDDYDAVQNLYLERGWSDGLPITTSIMTTVPSRVLNWRIRPVE